MRILDFERRQNHMTFYEADAGVGQDPLHLPWLRDYKKWEYRKLHEQPIKKRLTDAKSDDFAGRIMAKTSTFVGHVMSEHPGDIYESDDFSFPKSGSMAVPRRYRRKQIKESTPERSMQEDFKVISAADSLRYINLIENKYLRDLLKGQRGCFEILRNSQGLHRVRLTTEPKLDGRKIDKVREMGDKITWNCSNLRVYNAGKSRFPVDQDLLKEWKDSAELQQIKEVLFDGRNSFRGLGLLCERAAKDLNEAFDDQSKKLKRPQRAILQSGLDKLSSGRGLGEQEQKYWKDIYRKDDSLWKDPHTLMRHIGARLREVRHQKRVMPEGVNLRRLRKLLNREPCEIDVATKAICNACLMAIYTESGGSYQMSDRSRKQQRHHKERSREENMRRNFTQF